MMSLFLSMKWGLISENEPEMATVSNAHLF
jgi:hypothetical protein